VDIKIGVLGLVVGFMVGLTGMGGGALMTPALILLRLASPSLAVGTDLVWNALTKGVGSIVHIRQRTVDNRIVKRLAIGSIPGALAGIGLLAILRRRGVQHEDKLVVLILGVALVCVALGLFARTVLGTRLRLSSQEQVSHRPWWVTSMVGLLVGFLVSITSVGSGSLIVASLVYIYPATPLKKLVGSDIFHALFLVGVSAIGHAALGTINYRLLAGLLAGSVPGVWIGSKLTANCPETILRPVLATTLLYLGLKLL
jgi:uncharacterized protein